MEKNINQRHTSNKRDFSKPREVIKKGYLPRLLIALISVFIIGTILSAIYLYIEMYKPLNTHYSAILAIIIEIKKTLIAKSIKINLIFLILISAGIIILGILYTHRIAGPLHRIKSYAKVVSECRLDTSIRFRRKDVVHVFAEVLNSMTGSYGERLRTLTLEINELKDALAKLESLTDDDKDRESVIRRIQDIDDRIKKLLSNIKYE